MQEPDSGTTNSSAGTEPDAARFRIPVSPGRVFRLLALVNLTLIFLNLVGQELKYLAGMDHLKGFVPLFHLDAECNLPTYYSGLLLLFAAIALALVSFVKKRAKDRYTHHWQALAFIFVFLSVDEVSYIHEYAIEPARDAFLLHAGPFAYAWVVVAFPVLIFLGIAYARFLFNLPCRFFWLFVVSAVLYLGGAVGMEMVGAHFDTVHGGQDNLTYSFITTIEESMEMFGATVFIYALLAYLRFHTECVGVDLDFKGSRT